MHQGASLSAGCHRTAPCATWPGLPALPRRGTSVTHLHKDRVHYQSGVPWGCVGASFPWR